MSAASIAHGHRRPAQSDGERGASLIIVLAIMIIGALTIAALITYSQSSLRAATAYRSRTDQVQGASDAVDLAIAEIRTDRARGAAAGTPSITVTYGAATATCDAEAGSGAPNPIGGFGDRTVKCVGTITGSPLVRTRVQILDRNGDEPGAEIQVLDRSVAG